MRTPPSRRRRGAGCRSGVRRADGRGVRPAPADGPGYPSGHAALAARAGAHYPLDVVGGGLLGVALGTGLNLIAGRPA